MLRDIFEENAYGWLILLVSYLLNSYVVELKIFIPWRHFHRKFLFLFLEVLFVILNAISADPIKIWIDDLAKR